LGFKNRWKELTTEYNWLLWVQVAKHSYVVLFIHSYPSKKHQIIACITISTCQ
jgi:hypothetical protein